MSKNSVELIKKRHRESKKRKKTSSADSFDLLFYPAVNFFEETQSKKTNYPEVAASNLVVNLVTALEVYLATIVREYKGKWSENGYHELLKGKINLSLEDAYDLFSKERVTRESLIVHFYSFQNFSEIGIVFSKLLDGPFYEDLSRFKTSRFSMVDGEWVNGVKMNLLDRHRGWKMTLLKIFETRNKFIHTGTLKELSDKKLFEYADLIDDFQTMVDIFLYERFVERANT